MTSMPCPRKQYQFSTEQTVRTAVFEKKIKSHPILSRTRRKAVWGAVERHIGGRHGEMGTRGFGEKDICRVV